MSFYFPVNYPYQPNYYPQQQQQQSGILWVGSEIEAQNYPVAPNNAVVLWDSAKPSIYLKQADASGKPVMKIYDLTERNKPPLNGGGEEEGKNAAYALKSDLDAITAAITALKSDMKAVKREIKKKEVDDDDE